MDIAEFVFMVVLPVASYVCSCLNIVWIKVLGGLFLAANLCYCMWGKGEGNFVIDCGEY